MLMWYSTNMLWLFFEWGRKEAQLLTNHPLHHWLFGLALNIPNSTTAYCLCLRCGSCFQTHLPTHYLYDDLFFDWTRLLIHLNSWVWSFIHWKFWSMMKLKLFLCPWYPLPMLDLLVLLIESLLFCLFPLSYLQCNEILYQHTNRRSLYSILNAV